MTEKKEFYFVSLRRGTYNNVQFQRLEFLDEKGDKYSASCSPDIANLIEEMNFTKFMPIYIEFSIIPSYGKMKISVINIEGIYEF